MDLRGMLNDNGPTVTTPSKPPQPPPPPMHQPSMPSTPVQTNSHQPFRDYSQTQPSPGRHISLDYGMQQQVPPGAYASPPPYQTSSGGPYPSRPAPPPLQQIGPNDLRSPSITSGPGPSPYRQTPTSSISAASGGYPFPTQTPTSPVQRHQYPPPGAYHRDSFPQPAMPVGMTGAPASVSYMQGQQVPQTPPVATPSHAFPHQRSQSTHSTPTPTSAQSQHAQYGAPFVQGSPGAIHHALPMDPQQRQSSQPPTPVAAPLSRPSQTMTFQPPSPYQQRLPVTAAYPQPSQRSPPPPLPPPLPRHSSVTTVYDPISSQDPHRRSHSHGDRDRSISVSPKTRIHSLPSSNSRPGTSISDSDPRHAHAVPTMPSTIKLEADVDRVTAPAAKRKLDDRELRPEELERREVRPPPFEDVNGRGARLDGAPPQQVSSHLASQRRRKVWLNPPVWACKLPAGQTPNNANYILYHPPQHGTVRVNGKVDSMSSRHASPEEKRAAPSAQQPHPQPAPPQAAADVDGSLSPWETSIMNEIPQSGLSKVVADFLFQNVVLNPDLSQIQSNRVQFEIEAKLGTLIERRTNQRVDRNVLSECVLAGSDDLMFRSSMSEAQHCAFNKFLNDMVRHTHPDNKSRLQPRVPIQYKHRREIDKFFELPENLRDSVLPACVSSLLSKRRFASKVRVTYDQEESKVLAKIVKARIADLNLHFPEFPFDCRISINLEMDWDGEVADLERMQANKSQASHRPAPPNRNKDRLSYSHGQYQIDLTQVTQVIHGPNNYQRQEKEHELEIEVAPTTLLDQGTRANNGQPHRYVDLVDGFINNVRVLAKKAKEFTA